MQAVDLSEMLITIYNLQGFNSKAVLFLFTALEMLNEEQRFARVWNSALKLFLTCFHSRLL
jgi:hypothetical protein